MEVILNPDKEVVKAFISLAKKDPIGTAKDIANAYNENSIFLLYLEVIDNVCISDWRYDGILPSARG